MKATLRIDDRIVVDAEGERLELSDLFSSMLLKTNGNGHSQKTEYKGLPSSHAIATHLLGIGDKMEHSMKGLMVAMVGKELHSTKEEAKDYNTFYTRLRRAQAAIEKDREGKFKTRKATDRSSGETRPYRVFHFEKNA